MSRFPFGESAGPRPPRTPNGPAKALVLGVYPSALHVRWTLPASAPRGLPKVVGALAIADEPTVFWDGEGASDLVEAWKCSVAFQTGDGPSDYGQVSAAGNGTSGRAVRDRVLAPLGLEAADTWFTDAVDTFFVKSGGARRQQGDVIDDVYNAFAESRALLLPADLPSRPSMSGLVEIATKGHRGRLRAEIETASAPLVITLGEEARRVLAGVCDNAVGAPLTPLARGDQVVANYGVEGEASVRATTMRWIALAHPGNRASYWRSLHDAWCEAQPTC